MIDIPAIFKSRTLDADKLREYGFSYSGDQYTMDFPIMENQYTAKITISSDGSADFRVYETDSDEEYMPAHIYNATGAFVGGIHKACEEILKNISEKCYYTEYFKWNQSKRILLFIKDRYNAEPEFLWKNLPECAALRVPGKKPWFAVIGRVPKEKLGQDEGGIAEVINLKDEPAIVSARVDGRLAFPAYHMNKQHWYTLFLDDRISDDEIIKLIEKSYVLVNH